MQQKHISTQFIHTQVLTQSAIMT